MNIHAKTTLHEKKGLSSTYGVTIFSQLSNPLISLEQVYHEFIQRPGPENVF